MEISCSISNETHVNFQHTSSTQVKEIKSGNRENRFKSACYRHCYTVASGCQHVRTFYHAMIDAKCLRLVAAAQESDAEMMFAKKYFHWRRVRQIRSLYGADEAFRAVWEDYRLTNRALRHFKALGEAGVIRANEYRLMRDELVEEVLYHLKGAFK